MASDSTSLWLLFVAFLLRRCVFHLLFLRSWFCLPLVLSLVACLDDRCIRLSAAVDLAAPGAFDGVDIALFSAGGGVSRAHAPAAVASGAVVVDNSSAFRMDPEVPLVILEVNPEAMANVRLGQGAIVANPNCSTIICLMAAAPLHHHAKVLRMVVSTYQAASGAGAAAMEELKLQTQEVLEGKAPTCNIFNQQYAFNIFAHNATILENGYNEEEMKMVKETRKIWNDKDVKVTATCIRVPVMRAHAESVNLQFEKPLHELTLWFIRQLTNKYNGHLQQLDNTVKQNHHKKLKTISHADTDAWNPSP